MITLDHLVAACLRDRIVLDRLGGRLSNDLVMANPFHRRLVTFADDFLLRHRALPEPGDWELWFDSLTAGMDRDGAREAYGRLLGVDLSGFTPDFLAEEAGRQIALAAAEVARARLNQVAPVSPETFLALAAQVAAVSHNGTHPADLWPTLQTLVQDDDLMHTPDELVPRLAWRGTFTVLAGPAFSGKSTLGAQGAAALSGAAPFLDGRHAGPERVLWCNVADEPFARTVQRFTEFHAHAPYIRLYDCRHPARDLRTALREAVAEFGPAVVVIDSLIAWARRTSAETPKSGDAAAWADVMRPLAELAHEQGVAVLVFHHANRRDGHYRDSTEIAAAADVLIEMHLPRPGEDATLRRFVADSRLDGHTLWRATFRDGRYEWGGAIAAEEVQAEVSEPQLRPAVRATLDSLPAAGATYTEWLRASGRAERTFNDHLKKLTAAKLVQQAEDGRYAHPATEADQ